MGNNPFDAFKRRQELLERQLRAQRRNVKIWEDGGSDSPYVIVWCDKYVMLCYVMEGPTKPVKRAWPHLGCFVVFAWRVECDKWLIPWLGLGEGRMTARSQVNGLEWNRESREYLFSWLSLPKKSWNIPVRTSDFIPTFSSILASSGLETQKFEAIMVQSVNLEWWRPVASLSSSFIVQTSTLRSLKTGNVLWPWTGLVLEAEASCCMVGGKTGGFR